MLPLSDGIPARRFPIVSVLLSFGLFSASANGGGAAFFAHVGGFIFGLLTGSTAPGPGGDRPHPRSTGAPRRNAAGGGAGRIPDQYSQY